MIKTLLPSLLLTASSLFAFDNDSVNRGKALYDNICFSCHGKDLEGGVGFNLKDHEWIHGSTPQDISKTIKDGFPDKGMIAFGALYNDDQIQDITNFIMSRQEGLRDLEYKIYHDVNMETSINWDSATPSKTGKAQLPYPNFQLPEVDQFAMSYKGKLLIPEHAAGSFKLVGMFRQSEGFELFIDGEKVPLTLDKRKRFKESLQLSAGAHDFELRFIKIFRFASFNMDLIGKVRIPLAIDSYRRSINKAHIVEAGDSFKIIRKRIKNYAAESIAINHADRTTYIIDPNNAKITAFWEGKSLDIGPNINERGQHDSIPLAKTQIKLGDAIKAQINQQDIKMTYRGYSSYPQPKFIFSDAKAKLEISSKLNAESLLLTYTLENPNNKSLSLLIPEGLKVSSKDGTIKGNSFIPSPDKQNQFTIAIPVKEKK
ncbi:cytochrome c [Lentisphaera marina]|uniref:c-type cytochrome n=1 Tax=Lentisphaera marina TaxID=1111041 RepID=UPI002365CBA0|nr:cytochrome c [Lentisphaera marina]MDD7983884.1 cytochrome c [Lentisphaera marina]